MIVDDFGICFTTEDQSACADGYNRTVRDHLVAVHGRDVVDEAMIEGRELYEERHDRYRASLESDGDHKWVVRQRTKPQCSTSMSNRLNVFGRFNWC
jgi:hypothetical protein